MWIVAINAVVTLSRPLGEIPVACHSAMSTMRVVAILWAMTLGAELHHFGERQRLTIGKAKRLVAFVTMVTGDAGQVTVVSFKSLVKGLEIPPDMQFGIRWPGGMAGIASYADWLSMRIKQASLYRGRASGFADDGFEMAFSFIDSGALNYLKSDNMLWLGEQ